MAVKVMPGIKIIKKKRHSPVRKNSIFIFGREIKLQLLVQVEFCLLEFYSKECWSAKRHSDFFQVHAKTKSFLLLIAELKYVTLTFKVDSVLLPCRKKWQTCFSPALRAKTWDMLQWLPKVIWQCQLPRRRIWADLSCQWSPHISFHSPFPFIIRCPKSVIYNVLFPFSSDIFATNK